MMIKIPVCSECGDGEIEKSIKFYWDERIQDWVSTRGEPIYDCAECGECEIDWINE